MIWICTIFLLVVSAWFFFNALNERRWVQAHSHDETVAADQGFLPSFTSRTGSGTVGPDGKISIDQEDSAFARAVGKVREKTGNYGDKFLESKVAAARIDDPAQRPGSAREENTLFGRAVARVSDKAERMEQKLETRMKAASSGASGSSDEGQGSLVERTSRKVAARSEDVAHRLANKTKNIAQGVGGYLADNDRAGVFDKVSGGIEKMGAKVSSTRKPKIDSDEDLMTRISSKVGNKISELDEKVITASKNAVNKFDKS